MSEVKSIITQSDALGLHSEELTIGFVNVSWVLRKGNAAKPSGLQNLVAAGTKAEVNKNLVAAGTWTNLAPPRILVDLSCNSLEWIGVAAV